MNYDYHEVDFEKYCEICKHKNVKGTEEPCNTCLEHCVTLHSAKPVKYEKK